eukprot:EST42039.1 hypothetical protein SS50377_18346 [Spironucleus salmonicida]
MFHVCNQLFFSSELETCTLSYSTKMHSVAGLCISSRPIQIVLSLALIYETTQFELVNTLVHEMCHALIFQRREYDGVRDGHGPLWFSQAMRINSCFGLKITKYHYPISKKQLDKMSIESEKRRQQSFLGIGKTIEQIIDIVDLTDQDIIDLTVDFLDIEQINQVDLKVKQIQYIDID